MSAFSAPVLEALRTTRTVRLETSRGPDRPAREAIVWIVVDDRDRVLVRSWLGQRGRWYRDLLAHPSATVRVGSLRVPVEAELASDLDRVQACSDGLTAKYRSSRASLASMLRDEVLATTVELLPR